MPKLMLIIPAYNEEKRIRGTLEAYAGFFSKQGKYDWRILVVLNGCRDSTADEVAAIARDYPQVNMVDFPGAIGKGGAIIEGLKRIEDADLIAFTDADGATPPVSFYTLLDACDTCDIAVGSRWLKDSVVHKAQSTRRKLFSRCFNVLVNGFFLLGMKDTQCGAKAFHRKAIEDCLDGLVLTDMAFDVNLLFLIKKHGGRIREVPTEWTDQAGSTVHLVRTSLSMALSLVRLRWIHSPLKGLRPYFLPAEEYLYRKLRGQ